MSSSLEILEGEAAKKMLNKMLDSFDIKAINFKYSPFCKGLFKKAGAYVAFDNSTGECWTEEFESKKAAKKYLKAS